MLQAASRIYSRHSHLRGRGAACARRDASVPHDERFYMVRRLTDELSATGTLPDDKLSIISRGITDWHLSLIAGCTRCDLRRICEIDLSGNAISDVSPIVGFIQGSHHLVYVCLKSNKLSTDAVVALVHAVIDKSDFVGIDVRSNTVDLDQLKHYLLVEQDRLTRNCLVAEVDKFRSALRRILVGKQTTCLSLIA